jgi:hypothetical protein
MSDLGNSLSMPFEPTPEGPLLDDHVHYSGGVVVAAAVCPVPGIGPKPALIFRFTTPEGEFYPAVVLVCDDDQLAGLQPLISKAIHAARKAAREATR